MLRIVLWVAIGYLSFIVAKRHCREVKESFMVPFMIFGFMSFYVTVGIVLWTHVRKYVVIK